MAFPLTIKAKWWVGEIKHSSLDITYEKYIIHEDKQHNTRANNTRYKNSLCNKETESFTFEMIKVVGPFKYRMILASIVMSLLKLITIVVFYFSFCLYYMSQ